MFEVAWDINKYTETKLFGSSSVKDKHNRIKCKKI